jgi:hypothetical protein
LYGFTGNQLWLDRAIAWVDYCANYSDVDGDGEPAWGNYNETWGTDRYEYLEFTVHDGVIGTPIIELARLIRSDPVLRSDPELKAKADGYVSLVRQIVDRHHRYWEDVTDDSGYYWNAPDEKSAIVNRFAALGIAEMILADVLGDPSYLDKPERMARFIKSDLRYDEESDSYWWPYASGESGVEDTSHGSIDLEFMIMAYQRGLAFSEEDMGRLVNTYQRKMWQGIEMFDTGIGIAAKVDGTLDPTQDYTRLAKAWPLLCLFEPRILEQQRVALEVMAETRLTKDRVMASMLAQMMELEDILEARGIDISSLEAFDPEVILPELDTLRGLIEEVGGLGTDVSRYEDLVDGLYMNYPSMIKEDASVLVRLVWNKTREMRRVRADAYLATAEDVIQRAKDLGIDTSRHELFLQSAKQSYEGGFYDSAVTMCEYPLRLEEQLPDGFLLPSLSMAVILLALVFKRDPHGTQD